MARLRFWMAVLAALLQFASLNLSTAATQQTPQTSQVPLVWTACPGLMSAGDFHPTGVLANASSTVPTATTTVSLVGQLDVNVTNGMFNLRVTTSNEREVDERFGSLQQLLTSPMPKAGPAAILTFDWSTPDASQFGSEDKTLLLQLDIYSQTLDQLTCVHVTLPLELPETKAQKGKALGYVAAVFSVLFFGTNYLPVKAFDIGDGVFFQWVMAIGIWLCSLVVQLIRGSKFEPLAMLGGAMWAVGNTLTVPIVHLMGLGIGMCIWGGVTLVMGWANGRFGILGVHKQAVEDGALNSGGITLCVLSIGIMFLIKSAKEEHAAALALAKEQSLDSSITAPGVGLLETGGATDGYRELPDSTSAVSSSSSPVVATDWAAGMSANTRRALGITLACVAGTLYGCAMNPAQSIIDSGRGSSHGIDYVFSHFTGIFVTATVYMLAYSVYMRNAPQVMGNIVLPSIASGTGWGLAQIAWFIANDRIGMVGTFPLVSCGPGIVAMLCSIILYKEVQGKRNFLTLAVAASVALTGVILIAFSLPSGS